MGLFTTIALATASAIGIASSVTLGAISASNQKKNAKAQMRALETRDKIKTKERVKAINRLAASQRSSFLSSGISLTGDGTAQDVISDTYSTGIEDIENIKNYGSAQGEAVQAKLRSDLISTYGKMATDTIGYATSMTGALGGLGSASGSTVTGSQQSLGMTDSFGSLEGGNFGVGNLGNFGSKKVQDIGNAFDTDFITRNFGRL